MTTNLLLFLVHSQSKIHCQKKERKVNKDKALRENNEYIKIDMKIKISLD